MYKSLKSIVEDIDQKGRVVVAANAFGNEDSDGDISKTGSYTKTIKENFNRLRWFLNHDKGILLGVPLEASEDGPHLKTVGQLNMEKQVSRDVYSDYKLYAEHGKSLEHSVGVNPVKRDQKDKRIVLEWKWWEYSTLTSWGANEQTPMLGIKSYKDLSEAIDWMDLQLKKGDYTDEKFTAIEKQLTILRSLWIEPDTSTQDQQPNTDAEPRNALLIDKLKQINNKFKVA